MDDETDLPEDRLTGSLPSLAREVRDAVRLAGDGDLPLAIALVRILLASPSAEAAQKALSEIERATRQSPDPHGARVRELLALARNSSSAWERVHAASSAVQHRVSRTGSQASIVKDIAQMFDTAALRSPEASVALYSLGNAHRLNLATTEVVDFMRGQGLLGPDLRLLEIGCGIGRFEEALAPFVGCMLGLDVSETMVRHAKARCAKAPNVAILMTSGLDLACVADACLDLVFAVDAFPYLVQTGSGLQAGSGLAERHIQEAERVLRARGSLLILNYSYRGDPALDDHDIRSAARVAGFASVTSLSPKFEHWDGRAWVCFKT